MNYLFVENNIIIGQGQAECLNNEIKNVSVSDEIYSDYTQNPDKYIYSDENIIINPYYEQQQTAKREAEFYKDFFATSLGNIRRKVTMKTGETKDFLTDLLPVISLGVSSGQTVNIITYLTPDFTQEITNWEILQEVKQATPAFIQECYIQVNKDFTGI